MKYKVGDRVFHKELGWGVVRGVASGFSSLRYAVEFDEEFSWAISCEGLCKRDYGAYISEFNLSKSDSLWNDIKLRVGREIRDLKANWHNLTTWGKFFLVGMIVLLFPYLVEDCISERIFNRIKRLVGNTHKKLSRIFRIYKE